jgi:hypothetical protein
VTVPKVLILTGDAAESLEVMYPYQRLKEEGYEVHIAAPSKKKLHFVVHDFEPGYDTYTEKPGYSWDADIAFADVNPSDYAALVISGGRAPEGLEVGQVNERVTVGVLPTVSLLKNPNFTQNHTVEYRCRLPRVAVALQDSQGGSDRVPVPCRGGRAVEFVDLAKVADGLHVAPVHTKHELAFRRHHPHQPLAIN